MKELWRRVLLPVSIPVGALALIAVLVLNFSRVLIAVEESNSKGLATMLASLAAGVVLGAYIYFASREAERRRHNIVGLAAGTCIAMLACGIWGFWAIEVRADAEKAEEAHGGGEIGEPDLVVHAFDIGFEEKTVEAAPGDVVIEYVNDGAAVHTFVIDGIPGTKLEVTTKGATDKGLFEIPDPGEYTYFCDVPGHRQAGMEGVLTVAEGAGGGGGGGGGATEVTVGNALAFEPAEITLEGPGKITLKSTGSLPHTLLIDGVPEFKKLEVAKEGESQTGELQAEPGEYTFYCDIPGHREAGMEGKIKIGGA